MTIVNFINIINKFVINRVIKPIKYTLTEQRTKNKNIRAKNNDPFCCNYFVIIIYSTAENNSSTFFLPLMSWRPQPKKQSHNWISFGYFSISLYKNNTSLISNFLFLKQKKNLPNYLITTCNFFRTKIFLQFIHKRVYENL